MSRYRAACSLSFSKDSIDAPVFVTVSADEVATGLKEDMRYRVKVNDVATCRLFFDDVEIHRRSNGFFYWTPNFYAGRVSAVVVEPSGVEHTFQVDVSPSPNKLGGEQFNEMVEDIRSFDTTLLIGTSAASMKFGREGRTGKFEPLVRLARLRQHGPGFLAAITRITRAPHQFLLPSSQALPLSRLRRIHPSGLLDRRLAALATGQLEVSNSLESIQLISQSPVLTVDTPANRTLLALLRRFRAQVNALGELTTTCRLGGEQEGQQERLDRRTDLLNRLNEEADMLLRSNPFVSVSRAETTAAGLTQVAAHPLYSRAYRQGTEALSVSVEGNDGTDYLRVSPSWGIYEVWCYIQTAAALESATQVKLQEMAPTVAAADLAMGAVLPDGSRLELLFQAVFPSAGPSAKRQAWSVSRERRPDIVLIHTSGRGRRFLILDAKYRSGKQHVLEAMESAHIYHDALRIDGKPPEQCLLLLPGPVSVPWLEESAFLHSNCVGTLSDFAVDAAGPERLVNMLQSWCAESDGSKPG